MIMMMVFRNRICNKLILILDYSITQLMNILDFFQSILESMFTNTSQLLTLSIDETIAQLEVDSIDQDSDIRWDRDMTSFLWQEAPGDLPTLGWGMETSQDDVLNLSSLTLKAKGCTLSVKRFVFLQCLY